MLNFMNTSLRMSIRRWITGLFLALAGLGCDSEQPSAAPAKPTAKAAPEVKKALLSKNIWLEVQGERRRVLISATVCLREGALEELLCRTNTKEHEAILSADVDAREIHKALLVTGAEAGTTVKFVPKFQPPTGTKIKVSIQYDQKGKIVTVPAQQWIRNSKTKKNLDQDWVFAGSQLVQNAEEKDKPPFYRANEGDIICVINMEGAMLDLPIDSPKALDDRVFEAHTERIPAKDTKVVVILEPILQKKK
jgi:hypothetical protein